MTFTLLPYYRDLTFILPFYPLFLENPTGDFPPGSVVAQRATNKQTKLNVSLYSYYALLHLPTHPVSLTQSSAEQMQQVLIKNSPLLP